jgi:hypothetical protein
MTNPLLRKSVLALTLGLLMAGTALAQIAAPGPSPDGTGGGTGGGPNPGCTDGSCLVAVHSR